MIVRAFVVSLAVACVLGFMTPPARAARPAIAFVPLDDRPVTYQQAVLVGASAGSDVRTPPRVMLGRYLDPGNPDGILNWLGSEDNSDTFADVVSSDMIGYGGLVASRTPSVPEYLALSRLRSLAAIRSLHSQTPFDVFGTVMRLAPTGVPAIGGAKDYFAAGRAYDDITDYANLPDPPVTAADRAKAAALRAQIGAPLLDAYLAARARNRDVDTFLFTELAEGTYDRVVLGQDDAGPQGLHIRDLRALRTFVASWHLGSRSSIEPGADELGMILVSRAIATYARWTPSVDVAYSRPDGATVQDHLEFNPIGETVADIIRSCGARQVESGGDIDLFVRVTGTSASDEAAFVNGIAASVAGGRLAAIADLSFLGAPMSEQEALVKELIDRKIAGAIAAFASWNTTANTVGTTLPEAIVVGAGMRMGTYDHRAHAQFAIDRYADDYAFHDYVRTDVNDELSKDGVFDHTYLLAGPASVADHANRAELWPDALALLSQIEPDYRDAGLTITLPWDRTFETELDVRLAPVH